MPERTEERSEEAHQRKKLGVKLKIVEVLPMRYLSATLVFVLVCAVAQAQTTTGAQTPNPPTNLPSTPTTDSSSQQVKPPLAPLPDDSPMPDQGKLPMPQDTKKSAVKRKLEQLAPNCLDIFYGFHTCWSSPPAPPAKSLNRATDPEFAKDMEVGDFYLTERKNYAGAAMRFRDALELEPNDPEAIYKLAQSLEGLHQIDEARQDYETYLRLQPEGKFAAQAKKALERLQQNGAAATADSPKAGPKKK